MRKSNSKLANVLRAMDAFTAPAQPDEPQPGSVPEPDEYGYWTQRPDGGLYYHAYDPATEDDSDSLADHLIDDGDISDDAPVTCHKCGAVVDGDALDVQTAADGTRMFPAGWLCKNCLIAGTERLKAALKELKEQGDDE